MEKRDFYVYAHFDNSGACRYVGKGRRQRAWNFCQRSTAWNACFETRRPVVKVLEADLTELQAYEREAAHVAEMLHRGEPLVNVAAGGITNSWDERASKLLSAMRGGEKHWNFGKERPEATRRRIAETKQANPEKSIARAWLGKKRSELDPETMRKLQEAGRTPEAIEKRAAQLRGREHTEEHNAKISATLSGRTLSEEHRAKIGAANAIALKGKTISPEQRAKQSAALKGRVFSEEHKEKIRAAKLGKHLSEEHVQRLREGWVKRRERAAKQ